MSLKTYNRLLPIIAVAGPVLLLVGIASHFV